MSIFEEQTWETTPGVSQLEEGLFGTKKKKQKVSKDIPELPPAEKESAEENPESKGILPKKHKRGKRGTGKSKKSAKTETAPEENEPKGNDNVPHKKKLKMKLKVKQGKIKPPKVKGPRNKYKHLAILRKQNLENGNDPQIATNITTDIDKGKEKNRKVGPNKTKKSDGDSKSNRAVKENNDGQTNTNTDMEGDTDIGKKKKRKNEKVVVNEDQENLHREKLTNKVKKSKKNIEELDEVVSQQLSEEVHNSRTSIDSPQIKLKTNACNSETELCDFAKVKKVKQKLKRSVSESSLNVENDCQEEPQIKKKKKKRKDEEDGPKAAVSTGEQVENSVDLKSSKVNKKFDIESRDEPKKKKVKKFKTVNEWEAEAFSGIDTAEHTEVSENVTPAKVKKDDAEISPKSPVKSKQIKSPFNIGKLKQALERKTEQDESMSSEGSSKTKSKRNEPLTLRQRMQAQLSGARFRYINEQLYTCTGKEALQLMQDDPEAFQVYHQGFTSQVEKWPQNPVNTVIKFVKTRPKAVVADLGCGDAKLAQQVDNTVYSFDLVAVNEHVTVCDIAKVPLDDASVDIAVFCLALMGTNLVDFISEANRILKQDGILLIAEVVSRFEKVGSFVRKMMKMGFELKKKDDSNKMFVWFEFSKTSETPLPEKRPVLQLMPCSYKKR